MRAKTCSREKDSEEAEPGERREKENSHSILK